MFTGIIKEMGIVEKVEEKTIGREMAIKCKETILKLIPDDSVAIDGVCQTVVEVKKDCFIVQSVHTTLKKTTLGNLKVGDEVNLELPMTLSNPLGGHLVQGHVNATAVLLSMDFRGGDKNLVFEIPPNLSPYVIDEGSVALKRHQSYCGGVERNPNDGFHYSPYMEQYKFEKYKNRKQGEYRSGYNRKICGEFFREKQRKRQRIWKCSDLTPLKRQLPTSNREKWLS